MYIYKFVKRIKFKIKEKKRSKNLSNYDLYPVNEDKLSFKNIYNI